jgi:hypothetical protein
MRSRVRRAVCIDNIGDDIDNIGDDRELGDGRCNARASRGARAGGRTRFSPGPFASPCVSEMIDIAAECVIVDRMSEFSRATEHGEDMTQGAGISSAAHQQTEDSSPLTGRMAIVHCHDCWKYTDDVLERKDLIHEAVAVLVNGGTLCVENSEAFVAADLFLTRVFSRAQR